MKKQIVIGMPNAGNSLFRQYMKSKYVTSTWRAGAKMKIFDINDIEKAISIACECDGLLLPGGQDINPALYNQLPEEKCGTPNDLRDQAEPEIFNEFFKTGKPIFTICRGMQLLNVCCGGTLHQDISTTQKCAHIDFKKRAVGIHSIDIVPNTKLSHILGLTQSVNSLHHQVVDQIGKDLRITATSEDGFVEGIEHETHPWCVGVQWHPEHMSSRNKTQQKIFNEFISKCSK